VELGDFSNVFQVAGDVDEIEVQLSRHVSQSRLALTENDFHTCTQPTRQKTIQISEYTSRATARVN